MSKDPDESPQPASTKMPPRLFWWPALFAALPWLGYLYAKAHGGPEGLAALSGAVPNHDLEWIGLAYLGSRFASMLISPGFLLGAIVLGLWEEASRRGGRKRAEKPI